MAKIVCPTTCEAVLPSFKFDECNPEINNSQISKIYFKPRNAPPFADVSDPTEWAARLGNDSTEEDHDIRVLTGIGSLPKPTPAVANISLRRKRTTNRAYALTFRVDETNQANHDGMRQLQCGGDYTIWYETIGGLLFGGNEGIDANIDVGGNHGEGDDDIINHEYLFDWNNLHDPERVKSPL